MIRANIQLSTPLHLPGNEAEKLMSAGKKTTLDELCGAISIAPRVTGGMARKVYLIEGDKHFRSPGCYFVGVSGIPESDLALRVMEVLAYSFNDYAARETMRGRKLFNFRPAPGRPRSGSALSAAEKMRRYRSRIAT